MCNGLDLVRVAAVAALAFGLRTLALDVLEALVGASTAATLTFALAFGGSQRLVWFKILVKRYNRFTKTFTSIHGIPNYIKKCLLQLKSYNQLT